jgi:hypothetical protein
LGTLGTSLVGTFGSASGPAPTFTGLGHVIDGLTVQASSSNVGDLIGTSYGIVRDVGVTNSTLYAGDNVALIDFGLLAGRAVNATILNSYTSGAVGGFNADGSGSGAGRMGGMLGITTNSSVANSWSSASVTSLSSRVGGLVGSMSGGTLSDSYASGIASSTSSSVGGLVGNLDTAGAFVTNCHSAGSVTGFSGAGGLIGTVAAGTTNSHIVISNSYANGNVAARNSNAGGLIGNAAGT